MLRERSLKRMACVGIWYVVVTTAVSADTLVLRDGRRVRGQLVSVSGDRIEFDGERGGFFGGRERLQVDRRGVERIEFDYADGDRRDDRERDWRAGDDRDRGDRDRDDRGGRPAGLRERDVSVDSRVAWTDTGIDVRAGQTIYFSATGRVHWGPNRDDGPEGEHNSPRNNGRPIPSRPAAALIGRVGDSTGYFFIGDDRGPMRMQSPGRLYLGVNDDYLQDNSGSFRVTVSY
jgi:hypothetical protein